MQSVEQVFAVRSLIEILLDITSLHLEPTSTTFTTMIRI